METLVVKIVMHPLKPLINQEVKSLSFYYHLELEALVSILLLLILSSSESEYFKQTMHQSGPTRPKKPRIPQMPQLHDFQFFNTQRRSELYEKEVRFLMVQAQQKNQNKDSIEVDEPEEIGDPLLLKSNSKKSNYWKKRDFNTFIRACEKYGRSDVGSIVFEMEGKSDEEVARRCDTLI